MAKNSGYTQCACRDCFEITISSDVTKPEMCADCEDSGCEPECECQAPEAYGMSEDLDRPEWSDHFDNDREIGRDVE